MAATQVLQGKGLVAMEPPPNLFPAKIHECIGISKPGNLNKQTQYSNRTSIILNYNI